MECPGGYRQKANTFVVVSVNLREMRRLSAKHELSLNYVSKDLMMSRALVTLQGVPKIVFKGGTAINRVYLRKIGKMRFSEDIDLDYSTTKQPKEVIAEITPAIKEKFSQFIVPHPRIMKDVIRYDLGYTNLLGHKDKIMLEIRLKLIKERYSKKVVNFGFVPHDSAMLDVYEMPVMIKHKIDCILSRKEGKDIYDLYYLLELGEDEKTEKQISKRRGKLLKVLDMDRKEIRDIGNATNHFIPRSMRPHWDEFIHILSEKIQQS